MHPAPLICTHPHPHPHTPTPTRRAVRALSCFHEPVMLVNAAVEGWQILYCNENWCTTTGAHCFDMLRYDSSVPRRARAAPVPGLPASAGHVCRAARRARTQAARAGCSPALQRTAPGPWGVAAPPPPPFALRSLGSPRAGTALRLTSCGSPPPVPLPAGFSEPACLNSSFWDLFRPPASAGLDARKVAAQAAADRQTFSITVEGERLFYIQ